MSAIVPEPKETVDMDVLVVEELRREESGGRGEAARSGKGTGDRARS